MLLRKIWFYALAATVLVAWSVNPGNQGSVNVNTNNKMMNQEGQFSTGMVMQIVKLKSALPEDELLRRAHERAPRFEAIPGLIQKYYVRLGTDGEYGGVYIWDSAESLKAFKESELAATIPQAYEVIAPPSIEIADVLFRLRE